MSPTYGKRTSPGSPSRFTEPMKQAPSELALADEIDAALPGLPVLSQSRADTDRAQARMRHVGEQLGALVALAREGGTDAVLTYLEAMTVGERTVLLAAAAAVMAEAEAS